jgi:lipopolysaccharide export system permease protein
VKILGRLDRLILRELAMLFFATLGGVVVLYLVVDFADRANGYRGAIWRAVAELYFNKAAIVAYQLAPAALIIAAALLLTLLARRGEWTALLALGVRPLRSAAPVALFAAVAGASLFWLGEKVVVGADARAEEIQVKRLLKWGDWASYHSGTSWLRGKEGRIYHLGPERDGGWEPVTVLEIGPPFRLARRIDARRLEFDAQGNQRFLDATETRYALSKEPGGEVEEQRSEVLVQRFPETAKDLSLSSGRPSQLSWFALREQVRRRRAAGQRSREYELALAERAAQPLQAVPATLAALGIIFLLQRPRRRLPLAGAVAIGMGLSLVLWAASVVAHSLSMGGTLSPNLAAAVPAALCTLVAVAAFRRG